MTGGVTGGVTDGEIARMRAALAELERLVAALERRLPPARPLADDPPGGRRRPGQFPEHTGKS